MVSPFIDTFSDVYNYAYKQPKIVSPRHTKSLFSGPLKVQVGIHGTTKSIDMFNFTVLKKHRRMALQIALSYSAYQLYLVSKYKHIL